jgi:uncharacterized protein YfaS (alpha-2-macroglobulin family)
MRLRLRALGPRAVADVAIVDLFAGGIEPIVPAGDTSAAAIVARDTTLRLEASDLREDRLLLYARALPEVRELVYRARATAAGSFVVPAVKAEALYDRALVARSASGRLEVAR